MICEQGHDCGRSAASILVVLFFAIFLSSPASALGQPPSLEWNATFGGKIFDEAYAVIETPDGGFLMVGHTETNWPGVTWLKTPRFERFAKWERDGWMIKVDADGREQWNKRYGDNGDYASLKSVSTTSDGSYIAAGRWKYGVGASDVWLQKIGTDGNPRWIRTYRFSNNSWAASVQETPDRGFIIAGGVDVEVPAGAEAVVVLTNPDGEELWRKVIGGPGDDYLRSVAVTNDGGYIAAGTTATGRYSATSSAGDAWLIKMDRDGTMLWNRTFGGDADDWASAVRVLPDGSIVVAGGTRSTGSGGLDAWVFKVDGEGQQLWSRTFGSVNADWANAVDVSANGEILMAGLTCVHGTGRASPLVVALDSEGRELWRESRIDSGTGWANDVLWCSSGGFVVVEAQLSEQPTYKTPVPSGLSKVTEHGDLIANHSSSIMNLYGSIMLSRFGIGSTTSAPGILSWWDDDSTDGAFWQHRIPVTLHEMKNASRVKEPVVLRLSEIFGQNISSDGINPDSIRVIDPTAVPQAYADPRSIGVVPYRIDDADGDGAYSGRDILSFLSQVPSGGTKTYHIYFSEERNISKPLYPVIPYNLVENPGFELGSGSEPYYWIGDKTTCARVEDNAHSGTYRLVVEASNATVRPVDLQDGGIVNDTAAAAQQLPPASGWNQVDYPGARSSWISIAPHGIWESVTMSGWSIVGNANGDQGTVALKVRLEYADSNAFSGSVLLDQHSEGWNPFSLTIAPEKPVSRAYLHLELVNFTGSVSLDDIVLYREAYRVDIGKQEDWNSAMTAGSAPRGSGPVLVTQTSTLKVVYLPDSQIVSGFGLWIAAAALCLVSYLLMRQRP